MCRGAVAVPVRTVSARSDVSTGYVERMTGLKGVTLRLDLKTWGDCLGLGLILTLFCGLWLLITKELLDIFNSHSYVWAGNQLVLPSS